MPPTAVPGASERLTLRDYARRLAPALAMAAVAVVLATRDGTPMAVGTTVFVVVCTLLYPVSRFVHERLVDAVLDGRPLFDSPGLARASRFATMVMCWALAAFVAPLGLVALRWWRRRAGG